MRVQPGHGNAGRPGALVEFVSLLVCFCGAGAGVFRATIPRGAESAMVHLFEWSWADIARECEDWLGPKGFTAVQVSPPTDHINHPAWWARYQPVTLKLHSRSGNESDFADMVQRCARMGVGIYVDAVINHAAAGAGVSIAGSKYGGRSTPQWKPTDFHHTPGDMSSNCFISNYHDKFNVQVCDLLGLPDLCSGCENVRKHQAEFMTRLADLGVSGFRIDAAKHIDDVELGALIQSAAPGQSLFWYQEVYAPSHGEAVTSTMYTQTGALEYFDYARNVAENFVAEGKLKYFHNFGEAWDMLPSEKVVVFLDNHDTQRADALLTYKHSRLYELASIFMLAHPYGYPKIMSSFYFSNYDQGPPNMPVHGASSHLACGGASAQVQVPNGRPWVCEHRWTSLANMVGWRRSAGTDGVGSFWAPDGNRMFMCRGQAACIAFNREAKDWWRPRLQLSLPPGSYCNVIESDNASSCEAITVDRHGFAAVQVPPLSAVALHIGVRTVENESSSNSSSTPPTASTETASKLPATSSSTASPTHSILVARSGRTGTGSSSQPAASTARAPRLRGTPGHATEVTDAAELPSAAATSVRACIANA